MLDRTVVRLRVSSLHRGMPLTWQVDPCSILLQMMSSIIMATHSSYPRGQNLASHLSWADSIPSHDHVSTLSSFFFFWYNQAKTLFTGYGDERVRFSPEPTPSAAAIWPKLSSSYPVKLLPLEVLICHFLSDGLPCSSQPWMSSFPMLLLSTALVPSTFISFVRRRHGMICKAVHCW